jgi:hypothetical protein
MSLND